MPKFKRQDVKTFGEWMELVNRQLLHHYDVTSDDLPDVNYRSWYDDGASPLTAARRAIKNAKEC